MVGVAMDIAERKNFKNSLKLHNNKLSNSLKETKIREGSIVIFFIAIIFEMMRGMEEVRGVSVEKFRHVF